jgi:hypothetical protein
MHLQLGEKNLNLPSLKDKIRVNQSFKRQYIRLKAKGRYNKSLKFILVDTQGKNSCIYGSSPKKDKKKGSLNLLWGKSLSYCLELIYAMTITSRHQSGQVLPQVVNKFL